MKNKIKLFLCLTLTTFIFIGCTNSKVDKINGVGYNFAKVIDIIKNSDKLPSEYAGLGAVDLVNDRKTTVYENGSSETHYFYITQIINYEGKKKLSDVIINYDPTNEILVLGDMYTVTKDYKKIPIPKNQSIEQDDELAIYSPSYVRNKNRVINFPKVEPGAYIIADYTIKTKYTYPLGGNYIFDSKIPTLNKTRTIDYPKSMKLNYEVVRDNITEEKRILDDRNIVTFSSKDTKVLNWEEEMPTRLLIDINKVVYSFYKDWADFSKEKIESMDNIQITSEVRKLSNEIVGNSKTELEKVEKIYSYVINNFTLKDIYLDQSDFKPLNLDEIIYQNYGSEIDLNALFVGLVRSQNINDVYPVIILDLYEGSSPYQIRYPMDHSIYTVGIYVNGKIVLLNSRYNYLDALDKKVNYISKKNNYLPQVYENKADYKENRKSLYNLKDNQANIDVNLEFKGARDRFIRSYSGVLPAQMKNILDQEIGSSSTIIVGNAKFSDFMDYKKPMKMSYSLETNNFVIDQDKYLYFSISPVEMALGVSLDSREYDYQIYDEISTKETFRVDLTGNKNIRKNSKLINKLDIMREFVIGDRTARYRFISRQDKNIVEITREIYIPVGVIKKEDYREFKDFLLDIKNPMRDKIFIKK